MKSGQPARGRGADNFAPFALRKANTPINLQLRPLQVLVSNCGYTSPRARHYELHVKPWLVFTFATALPIVILIACNSLVLHRLHRFLCYLLKALACFGRNFAKMQCLGGKQA